ncbi:MAG: hypothetical protein GXY86_17875 [Firmicutes bacterium]|nr:hypothetical protein [Bacillota bacterium]
MEFIEKLINFLLNRKKLRPYEKECIDNWKSKLSEDAKLILEKQLSILSFQRQSNEKLLYFFYKKDPTCKNWSNDMLFLLKDSGKDIHAASLWLKSSSKKTNSNLRAEIILYEGRLSTIEFNKPPKDFFKDKNENAIVEKCILLMDPMIPGISQSYLIPNQLIGWLNQWTQKWKLELIKPPLSKAQRENLIKQKDTTFPKDYLELISHTDGFKVNHCEIHGLSSIRSIVWPDNNFYILAEVEGKGSIGVIQGDKKGELFYLDNEDDGSEGVGDSLRAFIEKELQ